MLKGCCARSVFVLAAIVGFLAVIPSTVSAGPVSNVYVFGDSLLDVGNLYIATSGTTPPPPYYNGRFSNGPLAVELFAASYGVTLGPVLAGGTDWAVAGALAQHTASPFPPAVIDQVSSFVVGLGGSPTDPNAIYVLDGGANDIANGASINGALTALENSILDLTVNGAKRLLIYNVPDLGATPDFTNLGPAAAAAATALSIYFDQQLALYVANDRAIGIDINMVDLFALGHEVSANPAAFGFTNVTQPCFDGTNVCANPDQYFYWDGFHPTAHTGQLLAAAMESAIPEPNVLALVAIAIAGLGFSRRKQ